MRKGLEFQNRLVVLIHATGIWMHDRKDWAEKLRSACQTIMTRAETLSDMVEKNKKNPPAARAAAGPRTGDKTKKQEKDMTEEEREQKRQEEEENMTPEQKEMRRKLEDTLVPPSNELSWNDVAGLEEAKQSLEEAVILPQKFPQLFTGNRKPWKGILLYGPPGTGKSFIAKVLSSVSGMNFFSISASSLMSKWVGESEKMVCTRQTHTHSWWFDCELFMWELSRPASCSSWRLTGNQPLCLWTKLMPSSQDAESRSMTPCVG